MTTPDPAPAVTATRTQFGVLPDGRAVPAVTLRNGRGVSATLIAYGATLQSLVAPDRDGRSADVIVGHDRLDGFVRAPQFFGATVGRVANRIAGGRFVLDGTEHVLPRNDGPNALHGGPAGFDKALWDLTEVSSGPVARATFRYVSPDGDGGYPGTLTVDATYSLDGENRLRINYRATTDRPTVVNLSNHAFWNLAGGGSAMDHRLTIAADRFTPVDETLIPTGALAPVEDTPFDFRTPRAVGERIRDGQDEQVCIGRGYDHNWVTGDRVTDEERPVARLTDPESGRGFDLWSNQPGLQFYSGNFLDGSVAGKNGMLHMGDGLVFEPQLFPDAPNRPGFPSARLDPGQVYRNSMAYAFFTDPG